MVDIAGGGPGDELIDLVGPVHAYDWTEEEDILDLNFDAAGQVVVDTYARRIHGSLAFTAGAEDHSEITDKIYRLSGPTQNPTLTLWGRNQTGRIVEPIAGSRARTGSRTFLRWKLDDSELLYGATADLIDLLTEVEAEALTNPDALPPNGNRSVVFFRLLAGIWSGLLAVLGGDDYDTTGIYRVMEAGTADDSLMMTEGTGVAGLCGHPDGQDPGIHDRRLEWEQYKPQQHPLCSRNLSAAWYDQ